MVSWRFVDTDVERARWRGTFHHRLHESLQVGVEVNAGADEIGPLFTWFLRRESDRAPAMFLGTSSDRIGSPPGEQAYYLTFSKHAPRLPVSAYATWNWSEWDETFNFPCGLTVGRDVALQWMFDGDRSHLLLSRAGERIAASLMWIWLEKPGISVSFGF